MKGSKPLTANDAHQASWCARPHMWHPSKAKWMTSQHMSGALGGFLWMLEDLTYILTCRVTRIPHITHQSGLRESPVQKAWKWNSTAPRWMIDMSLSLQLHSHRILTTHTHTHHVTRMSSFPTSTTALEENLEENLWTKRVCQSGLCQSPGSMFRLYSTTRPCKFDGLHGRAL